MTPRRLLSLALALAAVIPAGARATTSTPCGGPVRSVYGNGTITLDNGCASRTWSTESIRTLDITDRRTGTKIAGAHPDFRLRIDGAEIASDSLPVTELGFDGDDTYRALEMRSVVPQALRIVRRIEMWPGIAGWRTQTTITALSPLALSGYTLDEVAVGRVAAQAQAFRGGSDWREPGWAPQGVGDPRTGDWRAQTTLDAGTPRANGEWVSAARPDGAQAGIVAERRNYASSVSAYDGTSIAAEVDLSRDIVYLGPFEESVHFENPGPGPARHRAISPNAPLALEPAFTMLGTDSDDAAWQFHSYNTLHRLARGKRTPVIFNSDKVDIGKLSAGAKDDMNFARFEKILPSVRAIGADTFVFDDGWQGRSGDWCPDSRACPEPRWDGVNEASQYAPRFPDNTFAAVREKLAGNPNDPSDDIALGLWMSPMAYHPSSVAFQTNPQWSCVPVGTGTGAASYADPNGGSFDAGIGLWNPLAIGRDPDDATKPIRMIDYLEGRLLRMIESFGASYFKFDFMVWVDCGGAFPVTQYEYHDAFVDMLDRVIAKHPTVTIQIDDTNDHRMFPFETIARGPSWFLNGAPSQSDTLHTIWNLAPFVPGGTLGLRSLSNGERRTIGIDTMMASAVLSHLTFSFPIDDELTDAERASIKRWTDFYKQNRALLAGFSFPLLDDPRAKGWTALQPWDADTQRGFLFAFRQTADDASRAIAPRGLGSLPADATFSLTTIDPATGSQVSLGQRTAASLRTDGIDVTIGAPSGYAIVGIARVS